MSNDDPLFNIPDDVRDRLKGGGRRLESIEGVIGARTFAVITYRVDYRGRTTFKTPPGIIKFSKPEHAITDSTHIMLGSSRYYRNYEDGAAGVADPEEGRLVQRGSPSEFRVKNGLPSQPGFENAFSSVTWAVPDFLMFCTSVVPAGGGVGSLRSEFPDRECATFISDPSAFAMLLGKHVGEQFDTENVRLNEFDMIRRMMLTQAEITTHGRLLQKGLDAIVLVSHGHVTYCDPPESVINRFPIESRGEVVPFVKRCKFAAQREYRFVVDVIGEPKETEFLMEITDELRSLADTYPGRQ